METTVEQLIKKHAYGSLSEEELNEVKEWCSSEEEFVGMKQFLLDVEGISASLKTEPSSEIKSSLDAVFAAKHGGIRANWTPPEVAKVPVQTPVIPLYQRTWVRVAAAAVILIGTVPFWNLTENEVKVKDAQPVAKLQTIAPAVPGETTTVKAVADKNKKPEIQSRDERFATLSVSESSDDEPAVTSVGFGIDDISAFSVLEEAPATEGYLSGSVTMADEREGNQPTPSSSTRGMEADLHPNRELVNSDLQNMRVATTSLAQQPDDMLDFIVPAF